MAEPFAIQSWIGLGDLIEAIKIGAQQQQSFCVYARAESNQDAEGLWLEQDYFIDAYPVVNDADEESFPEQVRQLGLSLAYYGEQFEDVINLAFDQKPDASLEDYVRALNHYSAHDDFLDL